MRPTSRKTVRVRSKEIGGRYPLVCLPLVAEDEASLILQAREIILQRPDIIEWRADCFSAAPSCRAVAGTLTELRQVIGGIPLIFTCRSVEEGGFREISLADREAMILAVLDTGEADLIDFEISNGRAAVEKVREMVKQRHSRLILSYHNFQATPDQPFMVKKLAEACELGADIAKLAVMPQNYQDVLNLLSATLEARNGPVDIPQITMAMAETGEISRIAGVLFGSDITFAIGCKSSAPGQIPVDDLKKVWEILEF